MGWRGTVILALVAIVLGAYVWLENPPPQNDPDGAAILEAPTQEPTVPVRRLLTFAPSDVTGVRLERGGITVETQRHDARWQAAQPPGVMDDFLRNLTQLGVLSEIPAAANLNDYGLQPPQGVLQLHMRDQSTLTLQIGDRNPATTGVYVRVDSGPVMLAGALMEWEFEKAFKAVASPASASD